MKGVGDKALNQLEKSISSKLEAIVARQIHAQFQTSSKQALQEALKTSVEASVVPTFEMSCKALFDQIDIKFQNGLVKHTITEDPTKELSRLISEGKFEEAFTGALHRSDVSIVSWLCSQPLNVSYIHGTLMPPDGPESWPKNNSRHQWLVFYRINGMSPEGSGLVDRRGEKWWDLPCKPHKANSKATVETGITSTSLGMLARVGNQPEFSFHQFKTSKSNKLFLASSMYISNSDVLDLVD
ncbi:hypothetical protein JHK86_010436 [Glycine max]|nr:hypothetical protein JHK86_010436 [Glycine max]